MAWISEGIKTNPVAGALLADSGARAAGSFTARMLLSATVGAAVRVQHRDALNGATLEELIINMPGSQTTDFPIGDVDLAENERVRVVTMSAIVGSVQGTLITGA